MLAAGKEVKGFALEATDGRIGKVEDLLFESDTWRIRFWVVNTGSLLFDQRVLISPASTGTLMREKRLLPVRLTREQVRRSPVWTSERPLSLSNGTAPQQEPDPPERVQKAAGEGRLLNMAEVRGYRISAPDGEFGHVEDFLFEPGTARVRFLVIDPRNYYPGKHVIIPVTWTKGLDWSRHVLTTSCSSADIGYAAPKYSGPASLDSDYAEYLGLFIKKFEANRSMLN